MGIYFDKEYGLKDVQPGPEPGQIYFFNKLKWLNVLNVKEILINLQTRCRYFIIEWESNREVVDSLEISLENLILAVDNLLIKDYDQVFHNLLYVEEHFFHAYSDYSGNKNDQVINDLKQLQYTSEQLYMEIRLFTTEKLRSSFGDK